MAFYKHPQVLVKDENPLFDQLLQPGVDAPRAGIYRCPVCLIEIGIAHRHKLPPQNHHVHPTGKPPVTWQLMVSTHS